MLNSQIQTKSLREIVYNIPNTVTGGRIVLNIIALHLFPTNPQTSGILLMISVILDYFDGAVARKYNQCSFFGQIFDWLTDISTLAVVLLWWNQLQPQFSILYFTLFCLQAFAMIVDIIANTLRYSPQLKSNSLSTVILKYTMNMDRRGYTCKGIGYWNEIFHFLCMVSRVLYLRTANEGWLYIFIALIPMSVSYVWMHIGYTANLLESWNEEFLEKHNRVKFIDQ